MSASVALSPRENPVCLGLGLETLAYIYEYPLLCSTENTLKCSQSRGSPPGTGPHMDAGLILMRGFVDS